jgi:hypothetical protein
LQNFARVSGEPLDKILLDKNGRQKIGKSEAFIEFLGGVVIPTEVFGEPLG